MTEAKRKPPASALESAAGGRWNRVLHRLMVNAALEEAMRFGDLDTGGLCDVLLESFGSVVKVVERPDALRILCDACDSIELQPSALSRLLDSWAWMKEQARAPVDDLLFEACRNAHLAGKAPIEELVQTFDCDPYEGLESFRFELLIRLCSWAIRNKPHPEKLAERLLDDCNKRRQSWTVNPSRSPSASGEQEPDVVDLALQVFQDALEETDDPVALLDCLTEVCSAPIPDPQGVGDPAPTLVVASLTEACIDIIATAGDPRWAVDMLWEAFNVAVFDNRHSRLDEMMEAYRDSIHALKDPADLVDTLFAALTPYDDVPSTRWLPDASLVADACLAAINAGGGPRAAVDAVLAAVASAYWQLGVDESGAVELLCQLYGSVVFGSNRSGQEVRQCIEVLERLAGATRDLDETAGMLLEGLGKAARSHNDPGRCAEILHGTLMNEASDKDDPWCAVVPLMGEAKAIVKRGSHQTKALDALFETLREHRPSEPLVLLGWTRALMATSSGDWIFRSG